MHEHITVDSYIVGDFECRMSRNDQIGENLNFNIIVRAMTSAYVLYFVHQQTPNQNKKVNANSKSSEIKIRAE